MRRLVFLFLIVAGASSIAQTLPPGFSRVTVGGTISNPTVMAFAPDGRIFVAEQGGILRVIKNGTQLATPFITLTVNSSGERGLIGIAFDPDFTTNQYIYLYYTTATGGLHNRISRFTANGDVALANSEQVVLELDPLSAANNHNGGALAFGLDGKLYVAIGENANGSNAPVLDTYHGKFLRINKDGSAPPDNPFPSGSEQRKRVWARGLRNPYTFSIHPTSGRILLNDVGQSTYEEVNDATTGGRNFGWPSTEGNTTNPDFTSPIFSYAHGGNAPIGCAITGGTFFSNPNTNYPSRYWEKYFFMDLCGAWIYYFDPTIPGSTSTQFALSIGGGSVALTAGPDGNLYYLSRTNSRLYRIVYAPPPTVPVITVHPQPATVVAGEPASFTVTATGAQPLAYQWYKDGAIQTGKTQATLNIASATAGDAGNYRVDVSNADGDANSNTALLTVLPATAAPVITSQPQPSTVVEGQPASFSVSATGAEPLSYQWYQNGAAKSGASNATLNIPSATAADAGSYYVRISNAGGEVVSNNVLLTVMSVSAPVATIVKPAEGEIYRAGIPIAFEGTGIDPQDGTLEATAFSWTINFHHDVHKHDQPAITGVRSGSFDVPDRGETSSHVWYRFILTVTDAGGLTSKDSVDVHPATSELTFATEPPGLQLLVDGQPVVTPVSITSVEGLLRDIDVVEEQEVDGIEFVFDSWSIGGATAQTIKTPAEDATYTATFSTVTGLGDSNDRLRVYPNPANGWIHFSDPTVRTIGIMNAVGKSTTLTTVVTPGRASVDVHEFSPGMYVLFYSGKTKRIIIR